MTVIIREIETETRGNNEILDLTPLVETSLTDCAIMDGNGFFHVRAALCKASLTVPFNNRRLLLGTWQQIVLVDFDNRPRRRSIILQFMGK